MIPVTCRRVKDFLCKNPMGTVAPISFVSTFLSFFYVSIFNGREFSIIKRSLLVRQKKSLECVSIFRVLSTPHAAGTKRHLWMLAILEMNHSCQDWNFNHSILWR
jgi:hypothetical protein